MSRAFTLPPRIRAVDADGYLTPEFFRVLNKGLESIDGSPLAHMTMQGNATATAIAAPVTPVRAGGTTTLGALSQKLEHSANRLTYTGTVARVLRVSVVARLTSTDTNSLGLMVAKNGTVVADSASYRVADASGRAESLCCQTVVSLTTGDYLEVFVANATAANNITVTDLSLVAGV